jgi:hypothetical protein
MNVTKHWAHSALTAAVLAFPSSAWAQSVPSKFADLASRLKTGQSVVVTEADGRKTRGDVIGLSDSLITLRVRDRWGSEERRQFDESAVNSIRRTDAIWNGLLIGLGAGFVATELWTRSECGPRGSDRECSVIVTALGWVTMVPGGAVAGALIDKFTNRLVYRAGGAATTIQVAPVVGPARAGLAASVRF